MENPKITFENGSEIEILKSKNNYVRGKRSQIMKFYELSEEETTEIEQTLNELLNEEE